MNPSQGLVTSLNALREMSVESGSVYHQYVPIVDANTDIGSFGTPILNNTPVMNEFMSMLVNRIVYTQFMTKYFRNPLQILEGDRIPLGYAGQEIYINPAKGRQYNVNDFAGLLQKYEADVKVQYTAVNMDLQYPVTVSRHKLKQAFVSWDALDQFISELSNSLYNGAYIDEYQFSKGLVSSAFKSNQAQYLKVTAPTTEATGKTFVKKLRELFLNMKAPSSQFNAWAKVGGYGKEIITWSNPEDIVFLIRNDVLANIDVDVLASAFNMDKASLMGNIIPVDNFDIYADDGSKAYDGSDILGFIGDKSWFRIKRQDMYLDEFYNANNRTWQYYLNVTKMYNYSLFANGVVISTDDPSVAVTSMEFVEKGTVSSPVSIVKDAEKTLHVVTTPFSANETISYTSSDSTVVDVTAGTDNKTCVIEGKKAGTGEYITASTTSGASAVIYVDVTAS